MNETGCRIITLYFKMLHNGYEPHVWDSPVVLLMVFYIAGIFGPPPPDMAAVGITITAGQLAFAALAFWIDAKRTMKQGG